MISQLGHLKNYTILENPIWSCMKRHLFIFLPLFTVRMHLYSLTLQKSTAITVAVYGSFSAPKTQEIAVGRGKYRARCQCSV